MDVFRGLVEASFGGVCPGLWDRRSWRERSGKFQHCSEGSWTRPTPRERRPLGSTPGAGTTAGTTDSSTSTTEGLACDPDQIPDTLGFVYQKTIELGVDTLQAGYYDNNRGVVTVFSYYGEGRQLDIDGNILGSVTAPAEALPQLDGGAYDTEADVGLLLTQGCMLVEVDPEAVETVSADQLGHGMSVCPGLAIDDERNLYIASHGTNELVVLTRDLQTVLHRIDIAGWKCFDGIAEIAGSDNFLINDTTLRHPQIIDPKGATVVASAP